MKIPRNWTKLSNADKNWLVARAADKIGQIGPWSFWEHPTLGDEHPILATRRNDDAVYDTHDLYMPKNLK